MTETENEQHDGLLIKAYAIEGSEKAFHAVVTRHVNLVLATAERQVGDRSLAEEITQDVFAVLAKKAPRLSGYETLAGWLHKTTILEAKARIRREFRRKAREDVAAQLRVIEAEGTSLLEPLAPLLDEGLMHLRESDRVALMLRYFEDQSLRDVGASLGLKEEAARKRVTRALEKLAEFFKEKGFAVSSGTASTLALLTQATPKASAALVAKAVQAGVAGWAPLGGVPSMLLHLMNLTKMQTAAVCMLLTVVPLGWQWHASQQQTKSIVTLQNELMAQRRTQNDFDEQQERLRLEVQRAAAALATAQARLASGKPGKAMPEVAGKAYQWDAKRGVVRMPKETIKSLGLETIDDRKGTLSRQMTQLLQLKLEENATLQAAFDQFVKDYQDLVARNFKQIEPKEENLDGYKRENTLEFEINDIRKELTELQDRLFSQAGEVLDPERMQILQKGLESWLKVDDNHSWNSGMTVIGFAHRICFYKPTETQPNIMWSLSNPERGGMVSAPMDVNEIPSAFEPYLKGWIDEIKEAQRKRAQSKATGI